MRELADATDADPAALIPIIQDEFFTWEAALRKSTRSNPESAGAQLGARVDELFERRARLLQKLAVARSQALQAAS